ncbi:hypothetical protein [Ancylobacter amanitiformis]|uniref:Uncharacterized protein n=1 Tax=Ancylobacter amanitiformis TaxID=217069 RepID=A0ABU0LLB1_9HYPH|nr:hypothetical protein [Ancylobacter amanitiformis]MDQ0509463.1 hypothetical protein [Ancylobacter amanitiformis]
MIWQPLKDDPDVVEVQLSAAVCLLVAAYPAGGPERPAWQSFALPDGRTLQLRLAARPQIRTTFGPRAVITYEVSGQAVIGSEGFMCRGEAILDLKTRALLDVQCRLSPIGALEAV